MSWGGLGATNASHAAWRSFLKFCCFSCRFAWLLGHGGGARSPPGGPQESSHAAWRSFLSKTLLPMQRGVASGPRGWRMESPRRAPMQRGVRFFQKLCFPCSVAWLLGRGGGRRSDSSSRDCSFLSKTCFACSVDFASFTNFASHADRLPERLPDRLPERLPERQTDKQTDRQTDKQTDRQTNRQTDGQTDRQREQTDRQTNRQTDKQTDRKNRQTDDRQTERQTDREGHEELHQQGERAKHKHQKPKEETLY